jgi:putative membrane protein
MGILVTWIVTTLSLFLASRLLDGMTLKGGLVSHFFVAALFGILNVFLGQLIYFALGMVTLGLGFLLSFITHLVATAIVLKLADALTSRIRVKDFKTAFLAALIMSITASVAEIIFQ